MIHVGDKVKIGFTGALYTTYPGFLDYYREVAHASAITERVCNQYEYGRSPTDEEVRDKIFTVMFVREHGSMEGDILAVINDGDETYIIKVEGLTLVSSGLPFTEGDKVYISNSGNIYSMWDSLVKHMSTVIPDGEEVYRKWRNGHSPTDDETGGKSPDSMFTVKWIGRHPARPDEDVTVIISNNASTYLIGAKGLTVVGEKSWDKYIIYVRNWAVMNKDNAQSAMDATGPKSYAQWLADKS